MLVGEFSLRYCLGVLLLQGVVQFGYASLVNTVAERMVNRLKNALFSHILAQDIKFFDKYPLYHFSLMYFEIT